MARAAEGERVWCFDTFYTIGERHKRPSIRFQTLFIDLPCYDRANERVSSFIRTLFFKNLNPKEITVQRNLVLGTGVLCGEHSVEFHVSLAAWKIVLAIFPDLDKVEYDLKKFKTCFHPDYIAFK